jgi:CheY-like chemotaxis protein
MSQPTIFVADDDEDDQFLLRTAFASSEASCNLVFFANGEQLIRQLHQTEQRPRIVLLDLNMPVLDGFQTLQQIRQEDQYKALPVIILTTSSQRDDISRAYELGANSFIIKPSQYTDLVQTVEHLQAFWLGIAQTPKGVSA